MRQLILLLLICFSLPLLAQKNSCPGCFAERKSGGYTIADLAINVPNKPKQLEVYTSVVNELGVQDGWIGHFEGGVMSSENVSWLLDSLTYATMTWSSGEGITVALFSADTVKWDDRQSYVYDEDDSSKKTHGPEHVALLDITKIFGIVDSLGKPYPVRILACLCCQNAVRDHRDLKTPKRPKVIGDISGGGADPGASGGADKPDPSKNTGTGGVGNNTPPRFKSREEEQWFRQQQAKQLANQQSGDSLKIPGVDGVTFNLNDNSSMNVNINTGSGSISTNSGQYQPYPKDEDDDLVFDRKTRRYVRQSVIVVDDRPRSSFATTLFAGFGSCFGNYGGGSYYYPPSCNGVTGLTSSSAFPVNFNWQGRQVRKGMNNQFEAGGLGSATGPSVWPF